MDFLFSVGSFLGLVDSVFLTLLFSFFFTENHHVLQFGRCGADYFTLDARWPITPLEAFAVALTTFDAYDSA